MKKFYLLVTLIATFQFAFGQVFITELADPNNNSSARYVELYNAGGSDVDLSVGWYLQRWTNGNASPSTGNNILLTGTIPAGGYYVICNNATEFQTVYGVAASQNGGTSGPADSNGDDQIALFDDSDVMIDIFGVPGEDGSNTCHDFEDGRAERIASVTSGNTTWDESEWNVWSDFSTASGCTNHISDDPQDAPTDFDPFSWIGNAAPPPSVAAPSFSPTAGTYYSAQDVSMSTTTAGADIYYTTDGTDPDNTSTLYTGAVNIATTTTLKAIAWDGVDYSSISTGVFTITSAVQVADMATLRAQPDDNSTVYELTGEAFLTYQQSFRNKKYIQDATAGIEIDDPSGVFTTSYNIYDGITGIYGKLNTYNGVLQFVPVLDPGTASSTGNTVTPVLLTADEFNNNHEMYECMLARIDNLTFADAGGTFSTGSNYTTTDHLGTDVLFRTNFYDASYIGTTIPSGAQDVTGIVYEFNGTPQFTSRETTDIVPHVPVIPVSSTGIIIGGLLIALVLVVRRGRLF